MKPFNESLGPLTNGGTVVVIGGGPGGASAAISLQRLACHVGRHIQVILYEGKTFAGETHYNQCVGVLSPPIDRILEEQLGVSFPWHLVQRRITGYVLHSARRGLILDGPPDEPPSYAVRRVEFDAYLLDQVRAAGVEVIHSRVTDLEFHADRVVVYSESDNREADVVIGAFGLDGGSVRLIARAMDYRPPRFLDSIVTKLHPPERFMAGFGDRIHAFLPPWPQVEFGAVTPKGNHLTINIAGARVNTDWMDHFLVWDPVRRVLPPFDWAQPLNPKDLHYFKGRFPISIAHPFYADRCVLVGDAAGLVRAFKGKGINSACLTGMWAAETILLHGMSQAAFDAVYRRACDEILVDLPYGQAVRSLTIAGSRIGLLDLAMVAAEMEPTLRIALFDAVSGHDPYRDIIHRVLRPAVLGRTLAAAIENRHPNGSDGFEPHVMRDA
jgi:flavin-dependent dehydrogenase